MTRSRFCFYTALVSLPIATMSWQYVGETIFICLSR